MKEIITPEWLEEQERKIFRQLREMEMTVLEIREPFFFQLAKRINERINESEG